MYGRNVGETLKTLAKVVLWLWIIAGILIGLMTGLMTAAREDTLYVARYAANGTAAVETSPVNDGANVLATVVAMLLGGVVGLIIGWFSSVVLYAFGSLVSHTQQIDEKLQGLGNLQHRVDQLSEDLSYLCDVKEQEIKKAIQARQQAPQEPAAEE